MKLIENFAELLHNDKLPKKFTDWFIFEENDSEKECKFIYGIFSTSYVKDRVKQIKTQLGFYRKSHFYYGN